LVRFERWDLAKVGALGPIFELEWEG
jgi:hypothetical protein